MNGSDVPAQIAQDPPRTGRDRCVEIGDLDELTEALTVSIEVVGEQSGVHAGDHATPEPAGAVTARRRSITPGRWE